MQEVQTEHLPSGVSEEEVSKRVEGAVAKILRLLHISTRTHALATREIPMELNFLAQVKQTLSMVDDDARVSTPPLH